MTKRPMKRALVAIVMIAMLILTTSLLAEEDTGDGEGTEGQCAWQDRVCRNECIDAYQACRGIDYYGPIELCMEQYEWCYEDCMGTGDFWCGYRQI